MIRRVQDYELIDEIGAGSFSTVFKAQHVKTKQYFAIKKMRQLQRNSEKNVQNEIELLKKISSRNIVRYVDDFKVNEKWYIVFEYCGKGDLEKFSRKKQKLPQFFCKNFAFSLVQALQILHAERIVHRDLKLANILINDNYDFKLADFGFSKENQLGVMESFCGTPYAMSPEIFKRQGYNETCDTWSLGIMIYQLAFGKLPFLPSKQFGPGVIGVMNCVLNYEPKYDSAEVSQQCKDFIKRCLTKDYNERPKMGQLRKHLWINAGVESEIRREFLMNELEDNSEVKNRARQIFNGVINEHITKLIQETKLSEKDVKQMLNCLDSVYKGKKQIKSSVIGTIFEKIEEIKANLIFLQIQGKLFKIPLNQIQAFNLHCENIQKFLNSHCQGLKKPTNKFMKILQFVIQEFQALMTLVPDNFNEKIKFFLTLSELPIRKPLESGIQVKWSFNENDIRTRNQFMKYLQELQMNEILNFINKSYVDDIHANWLTEHEFKNEMKAGEQVEMGEFINNLIKINMKKQI